jgi:hypothetical protein
VKEVPAICNNQNNDKRYCDGANEGRHKLSHAYDKKILADECPELSEQEIHFGKPVNEDANMSAWEELFESNKQIYRPLKRLWVYM